MLGKFQGFLVWELGGGQVREGGIAEVWVFEGEKGQLGDQGDYGIMSQRFCLGGIRVDFGFVIWVLCDFGKVIGFF